MINREILHSYILLNHPDVEDLESNLNDTYIHFRNESFLLWFDTKIGISLYNRNSLRRKYITEDEFYMYLNIMIEIDKARVEAVKLRKILLDDDLFNQYYKTKKRNLLIDEII